MLGLNYWAHPAFAVQYQSANEELIRQSRLLAARKEDDERRINNEFESKHKNSAMLPNHKLPNSGQHTFENGMHLINSSPTYFGPLPLPMHYLSNYSLINQYIMNNGNNIQAAHMISAMRSHNEREICNGKRRRSEESDSEISESKKSSLVNPSANEPLMIRCREKWSAMNRPNDVLNHDLDKSLEKITSYRHLEKESHNFPHFSFSSRKSDLNQQINWRERAKNHEITSPKRDRPNLQLKDIRQKDHLVGHWKSCRSFSEGTSSSIEEESDFENSTTFESDDKTSYKNQQQGAKKSDNSEANGEESPDTSRSDISFSSNEENDAISTCRSTSQEGKEEIRSPKRFRSESEIRSPVRVRSEKEVGTSSGLKFGEELMPPLNIKIRTPSGKVDVKWPVESKSSSPSSTCNDITDSRNGLLKIAEESKDEGDIVCPVCQCSLQREEIASHLAKELNELKDYSIDDHQEVMLQMEKNESRCDQIEGLERADTSKSRHEVYLKIQKNRQKRSGRFLHRSINSALQLPSVISRYNLKDDNICSDDEAIDVVSFEEKQND